MSIGKKISVAFLTALSIINFAAGVIVDYRIIAFDPAKKILPHNFELSSVQNMLVDFLVFALVITLISVVTTYLSTDVSYTPLEIMENFALIFALPSVCVLGAGIYGMLHTPLIADRPWIIICEVVYVLLSVINFCCIMTIKNDE
ncbi:MAG: hypothetical protein IJ851_05815 [Eubacterium sp.]|nr:hypothetical protein [Eubacterium sp.]